MLDRELFELLNSTADAAFSLSESGEILSWNAAAEELFGFAAAEVLNRLCFEILDARGAMGNAICMRDCAVQRCAHHAGPVPSFDMQVRTRSGQRLWVNVSTLSHRHPLTGRLILVHLARDITAAKEQQKTVAEWVQIAKRVATLDSAGGAHNPTHSLSSREIQILKLLAAPTTPAEVAEAMGIAPTTLRNHLHRINEKLGTKDRLGAVLQAMHRGLI